MRGHIFYGKHKVIDTKKNSNDFCVKKKQKYPLKVYILNFTNLRHHVIVISIQSLFAHRTLFRVYIVFIVIFCMVIPNESLVRMRCEFTFLMKKAYTTP